MAPQALPGQHRRQRVHRQHPHRAAGDDDGRLREHPRPHGVQHDVGQRQPAEQPDRLGAGRRGRTRCAAGRRAARRPAGRPARRRSARGRRAGRGAAPAATARPRSGRGCLRRGSRSPPAAAAPRRSRRAGAAAPSAGATTTACPARATTAARRAAGRAAPAPAAGRARRAAAPAAATRRAAPGRCRARSRRPGRPAAPAARRAGARAAPGRRGPAGHRSGGRSPAQPPSGGQPPPTGRARLSPRPAGARRSARGVGPRRGRPTAGSGTPLVAVVHRRDGRRTHELEHVGVLPAVPRHPRAEAEHARDAGAPEVPDAELDGGVGQPTRHEPLAEVGALAPVQEVRVGQQRGAAVAEQVGGGADPGEAAVVPAA